MSQTLKGEKCWKAEDKTFTTSSGELKELASFGVFQSNTFTLGKLDSQIRKSHEGG